MIEARTANYSDGGCTGCTALRAAIVISFRYNKYSATQIKLCEDCCDELPEVIKSTVKAAR